METTEAEGSATTKILQDENFITTERGGVKILLEGHAYVKKKNMAAGATKFECTKRQSLKCYGAIKVKDKVIEEILKGHNHAPDPVENVALQIKSKIRDRSTNTVEKPHPWPTSRHGRVCNISQIFLVG